MLEVLHSLVGLVRSPVFTTALQVASRVLLVNVVAQVPVAQAHIISVVMLSAWSLVEIVRYAFYAVNLIGSVPYPLTWLRYVAIVVIVATDSIFIFFCTCVCVHRSQCCSGCTLALCSYSIFLFDYPLGVAGELGVLYVSLEYFRTSGLWSFPPYFNAYYAMMAIMASYAWGLPTMYTFMLKQRRKALGGSGSQSSKPKTRSRSKKVD